MTKNNKIFLIILLEFGFLSYTALKQSIPFDITEMKAAVKTSLVIQKRIEKDKQEKLASIEYKRRQNMATFESMKSYNATKCLVEQKTEEELWCQAFTKKDESIIVISEASVEWNLKPDSYDGYTFPIYQYFNPNYTIKDRHIFHTDRKAYIHELRD